MRKSLIGLVMLLGGCAIETEAIVTLAEYEKLQAGGTYEQANAIVGATGKEMSRVDIQGIPTTVMYMWQNPDGSNATATFQDGKLTTKAQFNLK